MELRNINTFLCVADRQSFSKAASQIGYTQSTVTAQIQALEQELGVSLFDRFNKSIRLTPQGEQFLVYARQISNTAAAAIDSFQKKDMLYGTLHIAMSPSICTTYFPEILALYHERYPSVRLNVETHSTKTLFYKLKHNEVDFIYTFDRRIFRKEHVIELEHEEMVYFTCCKDHPLSKKTVSLKDVIAEPLLLCDSEMSYREDFEQMLAEQSLTISPVLELSQTQMLVDLVKKGAGISLLPAYMIRDDVYSGNLDVIKVKGFHLTEWRQILRHRDKRMTPQMGAMLEILKEMCTETLPFI